MVGEHAVAAGSFGEVWHGNIQGHSVAVKVLKIYQKSDVEKLLKVSNIQQDTITQRNPNIIQEFSREVAIWRHLSHPNVLPLYGVYHMDECRSRVCLVSPWLEFGNVVQYLVERSPDADRVNLVSRGFIAYIML